ncbi:unnamed protein product, partial [Prorocentrum cordatum]
AMPQTARPLESTDSATPPPDNQAGMDSWERRHSELAVSSAAGGEPKSPESPEVEITAVTLAPGNAAGNDGRMQEECDDVAMSDAAVEAMRDDAAEAAEDDVAKDGPARQQSQPSTPQAVGATEDAVHGAGREVRHDESRWGECERPPTTPPVKNSLKAQLEQSESALKEVAENAGMDWTVMAAAMKEADEEVSMTNRADPDEWAFWQKYKQSNFEFSAKGKAGNPMAGRWQRAVAANKDGVADEFKKWKDDGKPLSDFRQKWAAGEYDKYRGTLKQVSSFTQEFFKKGEYLAVGGVAWLEGGGDQGRQNAITYATKAIQMGPPWICYDEMTETIKILYITKGFSEVIAENWSRHQEWISN